MLTISIEAKRTFQLPPCRIKKLHFILCFSPNLKMFFLLFYILNPFLWHISLNKSRLISAIFVLRKSYRGIITMHISIYPIFHRATSHLYVHVIVSACWFDHVMFTWGSRRYWCEIPFFRLFLKFVFHRVNSKNLGEKDLEINHLEMIRKKRYANYHFISIMG